MKGKNLVLVGGGGHCKSCVDVIETAGKYRIAGIVDLPAKVGSSLLGYPIIGSDAELPGLVAEFGNFMITIGQLTNPEPRVGIFHKIKALGGKLPAVVSPLAHVSPHALLAEGTVVMHHALINAGATIGVNCIVNTKALVEHDVVVGDHCHIATAAVLNGGVQVGERCLVGSRAVIREYIEIGSSVVIGAGARVMKNVPAHSKII